MAQQTAVDWLFEQIPVEWTSTKYAFDALQQAKQMEKEQIRLAILDGYAQGEIQYESDVDDHYNKRYGK
jgi:hypothetical protein